ncbi:MAG: LacI family DNA-binding transcriptional regulator [Alphaproteobacteria bacterium]
MAKTTVSEVARDAGVSRATADRVLNGRGGVSKPRERAVLESAMRLGLDRNLNAFPATQLRVCVLMKPPHNPFYELLTQGFREANLLFGPQAITAYVNHIDVLVPAATCEMLRSVEDRYDALVIVAPSHPATVEALRLVSERIPVVTLSTDLPLHVPHYYVGPDNHRAGRVAGELMGRLLGPEGGNVLLVAGLSEFSGHDERKKGFESILATDYPACRVSAAIETLDQNDLAAKAVATALHADRSIRGIYNISQDNDDITVRIDRMGVTGKLVIVCHDLTTTTRSLLRARRIDAVIDQDPILEARRAMEAILHHYGRWTGGPPDVSIPIQVYFRESLGTPEAQPG